MTQPYNELEDIRPEQATHPRFINEWDEVDEEDAVPDYSGLDPAFASWTDVNGMFFRRNW